MKTIRNKMLCLGLTALTAALLPSCDKYDYSDDLQALGLRVEVLEQTALDLNSQVEALNEIIRAVEQNGYVTKVVEQADGTYAITFNTGKTVTLRNGHQGKDGKDGLDARLDLSVKQDPTDGHWYWVINGKWILDGNGQRMRAGGTDGKDGQDGQDGKPYDPATSPLPQVRINPDTRHWEISTDGGSTWTDTDIYADGKDGQDGQDGKDGRDGRDGQDDLFMNIIVADDGKSITIIIRDGTTYTVPII